MKLGLALGAGGAKGYAHIGALEVLSEAGISFDVVSGTSVGSIVGAVYASKTLPKFKEEVLKIKLSQVPLLLSPTFSLSGFFSGDRALTYLQNYFPVQNIEELSLPFTAISVDLNTGTLVRFSKGPLAEAVRASSAIPGVFTPVHRDEKCLVDGALLDPLPISEARTLGADFVVALDLFGSVPKQTPRREKESKFNKGITKGLVQLLESIVKPDEVTNLMHVIETSLAVSQRKLTELELKESPADFLIQPDVSSINTFDFHKAKEGIQIGRDAAERVLAQLEQKLEAFDK